MVKANNPCVTGVIDCACVIHGNGYSWEYVENLYNMLSRQIYNGIRFHVYTEHDRSVPAHMIKHTLEDWPGIKGNKKSWWYKMQLFNPTHFSGNLLYLDLDVVLVNDLNWVAYTNPEYFWTLRDFKYLQRPGVQTMNSSMMWWNVERYSWVWERFNRDSVGTVVSRHHGDQDYLNAVITQEHKRYWEDWHFQSYRWQCQSGGYDFARRVHRAPEAASTHDPRTSVVVFHGKPNPHEVRQDPIVKAHWR